MTTSSSSRNTTVQVTPFEVKGEKKEIVEKDPKFRSWVKKNVDHFDIKKIDSLSVFMFGPKMGFGFLEVDYSVKNGVEQKKDNVFIRGGSACILMRLHFGDQIYSIVTVQPRVPASSQYHAEIPACIVEENTFTGKFLSMLVSEGFTISQDHLIELSDLAYGDDFGGVYPAPEVCDESIRVFLYEDRLCLGDLDDYLVSMNGVPKDDEVIGLKMVKFDELWKFSPDAKTLSSLALYESLVKTGSLSLAPHTKERKRKDQFYFGYCPAVRSLAYTIVYTELQRVSKNNARVYPPIQKLEDAVWRKSLFEGIYTDIFVPFVTDEIFNFSNIESLDEPSIVLFEWETALELHHCGKLKDIVPVYLSKSSKEKKDGPLEDVPAIVHDPTKKKILASMGSIDVSSKFQTKTIRTIISEVLKFPGVDCFLEDIVERKTNDSVQEIWKRFKAP
eukprot:c15079_g1_i1.p1 GENE.c15079_g1_i1~~c15079_g1_i1.p1  ORF type:complete len:446 (-),score=175.70 c15079_g1_i1:61-1398(-)